MQHVYLLTGVNISAIENNYQFNKGINILTISKDEAFEELKEIKVNICDDAALSERGRLLVNRVSSLCITSYPL